MASRQEAARYKQYGLNLSCLVLANNQNLPVRGERDWWERH